MQCSHVNGAKQWSATCKICTCNTFLASRHDLPRAITVINFKSHIALYSITVHLHVLCDTICDEHSKSKNINPKKCLPTVTCLETFGRNLRDQCALIVSSASRRCLRLLVAQKFTLISNIRGFAILAFPTLVARKTAEFSKASRH